MGHSCWATQRLGPVHACLQMEEHMRGSSRRRGGHCRHSRVWTSFPSARTRDIPEVLWSKTTLYQTCSAARSRIVVHDRSLCVLACFLISIGRSNYVKASDPCPPLIHGTPPVNRPDLMFHGRGGSFSGTPHSICTSDDTALTIHCPSSGPRTSGLASIQEVPSPPQVR